MGKPDVLPELKPSQQRSRFDPRRPGKRRGLDLSGTPRERLPTTLHHLEYMSHNIHGKPAMAGDGFHHAAPVGISLLPPPRVPRVW